MVPQQTVSDLKERERRRALDDLYYFSKRVYGNTDMVPHVHRPLCDMLQKWPKTGKAAYIQLILEPRGTFKSSVGSGAYPLWAREHNKNLRVLLANEVLAKAWAFLGSIKDTAQKETRYREIFGDQIARDERGKPSKWKTEMAIFAGRTGRGMALKEPTFDTGAPGNTKVGFHYDLIILDDLVSDQTVTTKEQIEKTVAYFQMLLPILDPGGKIVVIGTRYHHDDLYGYLLKEGIPDDVLIERAIREDGTLFFPERLSHEVLREYRSKMSPYRFSCQYLNEPVDSETATFKREDIQYIGTDAGERQMPQSVVRFMFVDPAATGNKSSDYSAIVVVAVDDERNIYVEFAERRREASGKALVDWIFDAYQAYKPQSVNIETVAFSRLLVDWINEEMKKPGRPTLPVMAVNQNNAASKELRVRGMEPFFRGKKVWLRRGLFELEDELVRFPKTSHDDLVDALSMFPKVIYAPCQGEQKSATEDDHRAWLAGKVKHKAIMESLDATKMAENERQEGEWF